METCGFTIIPNKEVLQFWSRVGEDFSFENGAVFLKQTTLIFTLSPGLAPSTLLENRYQLDGICRVRKPPIVFLFHLPIRTWGKESVLVLFLTLV